MSLLKDLIQPSTKSGLSSLGLTEAAVDARIHRKQRITTTTALIIPNDEMEDVIKIAKFLKYSGLLVKAVSETIQNKAKEQKEGFLSMLLGALVLSFIGKMLGVKRINRTWNETIRAGDQSKRSANKNF